MKLVPASWPGAGLCYSRVSLPQRSVITFPGQEKPRGSITLVAMPLIQALGTTVHVELGDEIDSDEFAAAWSRCVDRGNEAQAPSAHRAPVVVGQRSMPALTQAITRALIERRAGELLMLHAGAVCHPTTGNSIAYVAPGGTGKTTLSRLLGTRYGYLTDETVGIVPGSWEIKPYPKPLSTRGPEGGYPKTEVSPDALGLLDAHPCPRLTTLTVLRRTQGRAQASFSRMELFDAITTLVPETSSLPALEKPLALLAELYEQLGGFWLLEFSESEQLTSWIDARLGLT